MADENQNIEQNIRLNYSTNADQASKEVNQLTSSIDNTTEAQEANTKETKKQSEGFKSLKQQLREATIEQQKLAQQYGNTSAEAIKATKAVAGIKDEIEFQKDLVKSYNPDEKFRNLSQTAGVAALALSGVKDGFTALGIESKVLDQVIGSAQAILGVTSAVSGISDAYAVLTATKRATSAANVVEVATTEAVAVAETQATAATWSFNAALLANPIVLITAGILAAGAAIYAYVKITGDAVKEEEKAKVASMQLEVAMDNQARAFENNSKYLEQNNNQKIALLKASGASEMQIYKETQALKAQEIQLAQNYEKQLVRDEQKAFDLDKANSTDATQATLKRAQEALQAVRELNKKNFDDVDKLRNDHEVEVVKAETDARNKALEDEKRHQAELLKAQQEANKKRLEEDYTFRLKMIEQAQANQMKEIENNIANVERQDKEIEEDEQKLVDRREKEAQASDDFFAKEADKAEERANRKKEVEQQVNDAILSITSNGQSIIQSLEEAGLKKSKASEGIRKGLALTQIGIDSATAVATIVPNTINTYKGVVQTVPGVPGIIAGGIAAAGYAVSSLAGVAKGVANAKKILSGGSVGSGGGLDAGGGGTPISASAAPQTGFQASSENQIATTIAKNTNELPAQKVYVVESDISDTQNNVKAQVSANSF